MVKPNNVIFVPTSFEDFFKKWLLYNRPRHGMTDRQISLAAQFLRARYELSKSIPDNEGLLDINVMSDATKKKVREACGISSGFFQVLMGDLRKHRFFEDDKINPEYIPRLPVEGDNHCSLMVYFDIRKKENK